MIGFCRGELPFGLASFFRRIVISAEARCQANRGINATTSTKTKELLRFIPFFVAFYCLFFREWLNGLFSVSLLGSVLHAA